MADGFNLDMSDLLKAAAELGAKGARAVDAVEPVMKRGAQNIKTGMQDAFTDSVHFKRVAAAVSYDRVGLLSGSLGYEIGPEIGRGAGSLAGIAVEGGANGGGGTVDVQPAMDVEAPILEREIAKALDRLL